MLKMGGMETLLECVAARTEPALPATLYLCPDLLLHTQPGGFRSDSCSGGTQGRRSGVHLKNGGGELL